MNNPNRRRYEVRGQALIGLLIAMAIIMTIMAVMYGHHGGVYGGAEKRANDTVCGIYTDQIRQAISMYRQDYEHNPPDLASLSKYGVTAEMYNSPGCVYTYDATTGRVFAPTSMRPGAPANSGDTGSGQEGGFRHHRHDDSVAGQGAQPPGQAGGQPAQPQDEGLSGSPPPASPPTTTVSGPGGIAIHVPTGP